MAANRHLALLALAMLAGTSGVAAAQVRNAPPHLTVAVSFGQARPIASVPFTTYVWMPRSAGSWSIGAQIRASRHLLIDTTVSSWRSSQSEPYFEAIIDHQASSRTVTVSAIATTAFGRIRLSSGAGAGVAAISTSSYEHSAHCASACLAGSFAVATSAPAVQGLLALDVAIAPRVVAFTSYRLMLPFRPGLADASFSAGVRVVIK